MFDGLETWAMGLVDSPWILVVLGLFVLVDAFFPPIPSETLVIALGALSVSAGSPPLWVIIGVAACGAVVGDLLAYSLGRRFRIRSWRPLRARSVQAAFDWADKALTDRPASLIISARYIPVGRVAVNMTAGALRFPGLKFFGLAAVAGTSWAVYSTLIGVGAGVWLGDNPLLAMVCGVLGGVVIGYLVDLLLGKVLRVGRPADPGRRAAQPGPGTDRDAEEQAPLVDAPQPAAALPLPALVLPVRSSAAAPAEPSGPTPS